MLTAFTPGDLVILQAGNGTTDTTTGSLFLNEITTSGTAVQQIAIPNNQAVGGPATSRSPST